MAVKSAWGGGGVWGATASKAGDVADYEGEDACGICLNAPEAVSLQPCKHKICEACVARMRYQLISKASNVCVDMLVGAWTWLHEPTQAFTHVLNTYLNACLARTSWHVLPPWPATDFGSLGQCRLTTVSPVPSAAAWWLGTRARTSELFHPTYSATLSCLQADQLACFWHTQCRFAGSGHFWNL